MFAHRFLGFLLFSFRFPVLTGVLVSLFRFLCMSVVASWFPLLMGASCFLVCRVCACQVFVVLCGFLPVSLVDGFLFPCLLCLRVPAFSWFSVVSSRSPLLTDASCFLVCRVCACQRFPLFFLLPFSLSCLLLLLFPLGFPC